MKQQATLSIREANPDDVLLIASLIRELAVYEKLADVCQVTESVLSGHLFGPNPRAEVMVVEWANQPVGFALYFFTFSTFACAPSLYLEDVFIRPAYRRRGAGQAVMHALARRAVEAGCARFEWAVLDWNRPAIDFYRKFGADVMDDWRLCRLSGNALESLARSEP